MTGQEVHNLRGHSESFLYGIAFSPDGRLIASADGGGILRLWDVASGREITAFSADTGIIYSVAFSPDGRRLATSSWDKRIKIWDLDSLISSAR